VTLDLAVLISGSGSNLQSVIDRIEAGNLDARIRCVISNRAEAYGLKRAKRHGIASLVLDHASHASREDFDRAMVAAIRNHGADTVAMAGFMRLVTPVFLWAFPGRVVNIHPALLPAFPGTSGQADAADYGVRLAGCTVHFVDEEMDHGPVIIQAAVPARPDDDGKSLGARILALEHRVYPQALSWLAQGRLSPRGRQVVLKDGGKNPPTVDPQGEFLIYPGLDPGF
jgi:phosphoribosylglycinamide formyltransferase-1